MSDVTLPDAGLWFSMRRNAADGKACRDYIITDDEGTTLLTARAFNWNREILCHAPDGTPSLAVRRDRAFAVTGRADVVQLPSGSKLGDISRNGTLRDQAGNELGRFRDARSTKERARESVFHGLGEALLGGEGSSVTSGPESFLLYEHDDVIGALTHAPLPFATGPSAREAGGLAGKVGSLLPPRLRKSLELRLAPRGWKLHFTREPPCDQRLAIAAALFTIELSRW